MTKRRKKKKLKALKTWMTRKRIENQDNDTRNDKIDKENEMGLIRYNKRKRAWRNKKHRNWARIKRALARAEAE